MRSIVTAHCSYPLTNLLGIAHGEACALTIDHFLRVNAAKDDGRLAALAKELGFADCNAFADAVAKLKETIGIMKDLSQFHLTDEQFEQLVQGSKHPNLLNNPVEISEDMLRDMYTKMRG
ncbi:MAG: iron-containing alcohol dehydrogenase [Firmicutes bacterium]|nr:iron-containing alcohol dehydrogenase [Bacillota bacterium]